MSVNTEISKENNLIVHTINDALSLPIIVHTIERTIESPDYRPGMNAVWHFINLKEIELTSQDLMYVAEYASKTIDEGGKAYKLALVAGDDLPFGLTRIYEAWSSDRPVTINNFRSLDEAMEWISH